MIDYGSLRRVDHPLPSESTNSQEVHFPTAAINSRVTDSRLKLHSLKETASLQLYI